MIDSSSSEDVSCQPRSPQQTPAATGQDADKPVPSLIPSVDHPMAEPVDFPPSVVSPLLTPVALVVVAGLPPTTVKPLVAVGGPLFKHFPLLVTAEILEVDNKRSEQVPAREQSSRSLAPCSSAFSSIGIMLSDILERKGAYLCSEYRVGSQSRPSSPPVRKFRVAKSAESVTHGLTVPQVLPWLEPESHFTLQVGTTTYWDAELLTPLRPVYRPPETSAAAEWPVPLGAA